MAMQSNTREPNGRRRDSGTRRVARMRVLLAHDAASPACDGLAECLVAMLGPTFGTIEVLEATSVSGAEVAAVETKLEVAFVCLDLPPAPGGGVRLAEALCRRGVPVVLVTRSLRWLPRSADELRALPWIAPDAGPEAVARAMASALSAASTGEAEAPGGTAAALG